MAIHLARHNVLSRSGSVISVCLKNELKTKIAALSKALFEQQKQQAADNKKHATAAVASAAQKVPCLTFDLVYRCFQAIDEGHSHLVYRVDVGLEAKLLLDAIGEAQKTHTDLCIMLFSVDQAKNKTLAVAVAHILSHDIMT